MEGEINFLSDFKNILSLSLERMAFPGVSGICVVILTATPIAKTSNPKISTNGFF